MTRNLLGPKLESRGYREIMRLNAWAERRVPECLAEVLHPGRPIWFGLDRPASWLDSLDEVIPDLGARSRFFFLVTLSVYHTWDGTGLGIDEDDLPEFPITLGDVVRGLIDAVIRAGRLALCG